MLFSILYPVVASRGSQGCTIHFLESAGNEFCTIYTNNDASKEASVSFESVGVAVVVPAHRTYDSVDFFAHGSRHVVHQNLGGGLTIKDNSLSEVMNIHPEGQITFYSGEKTPVYSGDIVLDEFSDSMVLLSLVDGKLDIDELTRRMMEAIEDDLKAVNGFVPSEKTRRAIAKWLIDYKWHHYLPAE